MYWNKSYYKTIVLNIDPRIGPPAVRPQLPVRPAGPSAAAAVRERARPVRPQPRPAFYNAF